MTTRDMHIELDQSTQVVAANRTRKWYPEEKDWVLNKIQEQFIRSKLRPLKDREGKLTGGFELDQAGTDDIRMLLSINVPLKAYIQDNERYKCYLPADYAYLVGDGSRTSLLCGAAPAVSNETLYISFLQQQRSALSSGPYYATESISMPNTTLTLPNDMPYGNTYTGYADKNDIDFLVPWILWKGGWRWERFDNFYKPSSYIWVQSSNPSIPAIIVDGNAATVESTSTMAMSYHTASGSKLVNNRLSSSDTIRSLRQASFYKTAAYSPLSELEKDILWVYRDDNFIVSAVEISYIRKPRPIDISLNSNCELAEGTHRIICDLAAEYLQGRAKDLQGREVSEAQLTKRIVL